MYFVYTYYQSQKWTSNDFQIYKHFEIVYVKKNVIQLWSAFMKVYYGIYILTAPFSDWAKWAKDSSVFANFNTDISFLPILKLYTRTWKSHNLSLFSRQNLIKKKKEHSIIHNILFSSSKSGLVHLIQDCLELLLLFMSSDVSQLSVH